jgi:hypothetical protein
LPLHAVFPDPNRFLITLKIEDEDEFEDEDDYRKASQTRSRATDSYTNPRKRRLQPLHPGKLRRQRLEPSLTRICERCRLWPPDVIFAG